MRKAFDNEMQKNGYTRTPLLKYKNTFQITTSVVGRRKHDKANKMVCNFKISINSVFILPFPTASESKVSAYFLRCRSKENVRIPLTHSVIPRISRDARVKLPKPET